MSSSVLSFISSGKSNLSGRNLFVKVSIALVISSLTFSLSLSRSLSASMNALFVADTTFAYMFLKSLSVFSFC